MRNPGRIIEELITSAVTVSEERELPVKLQRAWRPVLVDLSKDFLPSRAFALADKIGRKISVLASEKEIELHGDVWVDPAPFQPHVQRLAALFNRVAPSSAYMQWQNEKRQELAAALSVREDFQTAARTWSSYSIIERDNILRELARAHHQIYGRDLYPEPSIDFIYEVKARKGIENEHYSRASCGLDRDEWTIKTNVHPDTGFNDFLTAMDIQHHENTHGGQQNLARLHGYDKIAPNHPLYKDAFFWRELKAYRNSYLSTIRPVYINHPAEVDAFRQGHSFADDLRKAFGEQGIDLPLTATHLAWRAADNSTPQI